MAKKGNREIIKLKSTESHYTYTTTKNKRSHPDRFQIKKYDPVVRKRVLFKEAR